MVDRVSQWEREAEVVSGSDREGEQKSARLSQVKTAEEESRE